MSKARCELFMWTLPRWTLASAPELRASTVDHDSPVVRDSASMLPRGRADVPRVRAGSALIGGAVSREVLAVSTDQWTLRGLLSCASCGGRLQPLQIGGGPRAYRGPCGCRLRPIDAAIVERLAYDAAEQHAPTVISGMPAECHKAVFRQLFAEILVGPTPDEMQIIWRT